MQDARFSKVPAEGGGGGVLPIIGSLRIDDVRMTAPLGHVIGL